MLTLAKTLDRALTKMQQVEETRNALDLFDEVDCYLRHVAEQKRLCNEKDSTANHSSLRLIMLVLMIVLCEIGLNRLSYTVLTTPSVS